MNRRTRPTLDSRYLADGGETGVAGTVLGLTTSEGVLVAADTRASSAAAVSSEDVQKLSQVHPTAVLGSSSDPGAVQSFVRTLRADADRYETAKEEPMDIPTLATVAATELREHSMPDVTLLLGGVDDSPHVCTIRREGGVLSDEYAAIGSGRDVVYGVLDADAPQSPSMPAARRVAGRAIESAVERDTRTGVGVQVAEITEEGVQRDRYDSVDDLL